MRKIWIDGDAALGMECRILVFDAGPGLQSRSWSGTDARSQCSRRSE